MDNRIVWGGYDAVYHFGRTRRLRLRGPAGHLPPAGRALLHHLPSTRRRPVHPSLGRRHRHQHAVLRALGTGPRRPGRLRQRVHRARRRRGAVRRRRVPGPARGPRRRRAPAGDGAQASRCRFRRSRSPASGSRPPGGHWTAPITPRAAATSCCGPSTRWVSASIPDVTAVTLPFTVSSRLAQR